MTATLAFARPPRPVSQATFRRRRAVVGVSAAIVVSFGTVATFDVLAGSGGVPASAAASQPALVRSTITAQPGDTMWSIAEVHRGDADLVRFVDELIALNGGTSLQIGQLISLP